MIEAERKTMTRTMFAAAAAVTAGVLAGAQARGEGDVLADAQAAARAYAEKTAERLPDAPAHPGFRQMFVNSYLDTITRTAKWRTDDAGRDDTYVITGDINAMWLRDSCAQVWPYLPLAKDSEPVARVIRGTINRAFSYIRIDPYANAFYDSTDRKSEHSGDRTTMLPGVHERKWELDSLCYPLRLAHGYWRATGDKTPFGDEWVEAVRKILATMRVQQRRDAGKSAEYTFRRRDWSPTETLAHGVGAPVKPVGLVAQGFRPSDDACIFPFNVPGNIFAVDVLAKTAQVLREARGDDALAKECEVLSAEIADAVRRNAVFEHPEFGLVYAYEIDGYGGRLFMDDANVPSLLSLPYLCDAKSFDPSVWAATRRMVLSKEGNPWFFKGSKGEGIGSPHTGYDRVWPMSVAMRALVSRDREEVASCIRQLLSTTGGKNAMHESFHADNDRRYSRGWFAWADGLFAEAVIHALEIGAVPAN